MSKYKEALELWEYYQNADLSDMGHPDFDDWLKEQDKPKDPLFEKFEKFVMMYIDGNYDFSQEDDVVLMFDGLKKFFKEELKGTRGLDFVRAGILERKARGEATVSCNGVLHEIGLLEERLENE